MRSTLGASVTYHRMNRHKNKRNAENRDQNFRELSRQIKLGWAASVHT